MFKRNFLIKLTFLSLLVLSNANAAINVTGQGEIEQRPNIASFSISVETKSLIAKEAASDNAKQTDKAIQVLKTVIDNPQEIYTQGYNLFPEYKYDRKQEKQVFIGFKSVNTIYVTTKNIKMIGDILDKVIASGITGINNLNFSYDQPEKLYQEALKKAVENAFERADVLAKAGRIDKGNVDEINVLDSLTISPPVPKTMRLMAEASNVTTPINAPNVRSVATVEVKFQ